jgi:hypothetical protein
MKSFDFGVWSDNGLVLTFYATLGSQLFIFKNEQNLSGK